MHKLDEYLKHSGVKGMKWGVHKSQEQTGVKKAVRRLRKFEAAIDAHHVDAKTGEYTNQSKRAKMIRLLSPSALIEKTPLKETMRKARIFKAKIDPHHINEKTGEYTHQSKSAKTLRIMSKALGLAVAGVGVAASVMLQKENGEILKHSGVKGMKWDPDKKKQQLEIYNLANQYGLSKLEAARLQRVIKEKHLKPNDVAKIVNYVKKTTSNAIIGAKKEASGAISAYEKIKKKIKKRIKSSVDREKRLAKERAALKKRMKSDLKYLTSSTRNQ